MNVNVYKASPIGAQQVPDLAIVATVPFPETATLDVSRAMHDAQGLEIVEGLLSALPGGTIDAVLYHLMLKRASVLRVLVTP